MGAAAASQGGRAEGVVHEQSARPAAHGCSCEGPARVGVGRSHAPGPGRGPAVVCRPGPGQRIQVGPRPGVCGRLPPGGTAAGTCSCAAGVCWVPPSLRAGLCLSSGALSDRPPSRGAVRAIPARSVWPHRASCVLAGAARPPCSRPRGFVPRRRRLHAPGVALPCAGPGSLCSATGRECPEPSASPFLPG